MRTPRPLKDMIETGDVVQIGSALYSRCARCGSVVQINKPIFGSLHLCVKDE